MDLLRLYCRAIAPKWGGGAGQTPAQSPSFPHAEPVTKMPFRTSDSTTTFFMDFSLFFALEL